MIPVCQTEQQKLIFLGEKCIFYKNIRYMEKEKWKVVKGTNSMYEVSSHGRVRSWKKNKWGRADKPKILKQQAVGKEYKNKNHYLGVGIDGVKNRVHRLVAEYFVPNPENKPQVNHKDGIKTNNYYKNLDWSTHKENFDHVVENGYMPNGESHHNSKLTKDDVLEIRSIAKERGYFYDAKELSNRFNVSEENIKCVVRRDIWDHI